MANISRDSYIETSLYDKVIQQQGMPFTDYDFNEMQDIQRVKLRRVIYELLGDGAIGSGWKVQAKATPSMTVDILSGTYYVSGYRVINNSTQSVVIGAAPGSGSRLDTIYFHFKEVEIDSTQDPAIKHSSLTIEPTRRTKIQSDVNYLQGSTTIPSNTATDFYVLLATISVASGTTSITNGMITDNRQIKAIFSTGNQNFTGTITSLGSIVNGPETIQGNTTYQPTGIWSTSQVNSLIHNPLYNSAGNTAIVAQIDFIRTSVTDGGYDGEISLKTRATGGALTEAGRFKKDGSLTVASSVTASSFIGSFAWGNLTGKPTTLGGYGITDNIVTALSVGANLTITNPTSGLGVAILGVQNLVDTTTTQTINGAKTFGNIVTIPTNSIIKGTGTPGVGNSSIIGFYEADGTTRKGMVGDGSAANNDIYLTADVGNVNLSTATSGIGLSLNQSGSLTTGKGNTLDDGVTGAASFQSSITANTAPTQGGHLTNKTYVDGKTPTRASASELLLGGTAATDVLTYTPTAAGNFTVKVYLRVVTGATNVTVNITYTSAGGAQTYAMLPITSLAVGDKSFVPYFFNSTAAIIKITVTAGTANQVYATAVVTGE